MTFAGPSLVVNEKLPASPRSPSESPLAANVATAVEPGYSGTHEGSFTLPPISTVAAFPFSSKARMLNLPFLS